jgi:hypothetical protein
MNGVYAISRVRPLQVRARRRETFMIADSVQDCGAICYHRAEGRKMAPRLALDQAYPGIPFRQRSRNWWARLMRYPAECVHLETQHGWMATFIPDTLYLCGKASPRRRPGRPEVSLCLGCLVGLMEPELAAHRGRVIAFEPDGESFTQFFFVGREEFEAAGLRPEVAAAIEKRLQQPGGACSECSAWATWLWISRREVSNLDQTERIEESPGAGFCARHGAAKLCAALRHVGEANLFYVNMPYGDAGAYVWI